MLFPNNARDVEREIWMKYEKIDNNPIIFLKLCKKWITVIANAASRTVARQARR